MKVCACNEVSNKVCIVDFIHGRPLRRYVVVASITDLELNLTKPLLAVPYLQLAMLWILN